jgi:amidase
MSNDPLLLPVTEQLALLASGRLSAGELMSLTLARIDKLNPALNAVVALAPEKAKAAAREADERWANKTARPLEGLPITIKDAFDVAGFPSTSGSPALKDRVPERDATAVARLRQAGAIVIGRSPVPVFCGDFQTMNPMHAAVNNPWNAAFSAGGSSGGAAVAVATGMSSFELGSDQGSSIRWPAATNGVAGLKTSWGLINSWGIIPPPPDKRIEKNVELVTVGPIARHAADLDMLLSILSGPRDTTVAGSVLPPPRRMDAKGLRVAVWLDQAFAPVEAEVAAGVRHAAKILADAGADVDEQARPSFRFEEVYEVFALLNHWLVGYGLPARVRDKIASAASLVSPDDLSHRALQARGMRMTPGLFQQVDARRRKLMRQWAAFFTRYDVVLCPAAPVVSLRHDHDPNIMGRKLDLDGASRPYLDFLLWAAPAAGANLPAAVGPAGLAANGMPRGVQIIAPHMEDRMAVQTAVILQQLQGGFRAPPIAM